MSSTGLELYGSEPEQNSQMAVLDGSAVDVSTGEEIPCDFVDVGPTETLVLKPPDW